jgi:phenylalanyl-tRNA synthetase beta chain
MKFSEKWLREWINPSVNTEELAEQLTFLGLEVDEVVDCTPAMSEVVIARVVDVIKHPDADRLRICEVDNGTSDLLQIVCGAPNVRAGMVTALANVGCPMPDGKPLKKAKLRGVESNGMLCSPKEIGLSEDSDGIIELDEKAPVGELLVAYLELDDNIIDVDLTPDRGDCLSIRGIARDLSARNDLPLQLHEITPVANQVDDVWPVRLSSSSACARYAGRVVKGVNMHASTPVWMSERLRRSGVRSINPAVDITNYVMLELGQPMHAFDLDKVQGDIQVRLAGEGEKLVLLDKREVTLTAETTVIADDSGAIGIAGIMGGLSTAVDSDTKNIFLEAALFLPEHIIGKPRHYASPSESSHRFERGVDPALQSEAMEYATGLLMKLAGGKPGPIRDWQDAPRLPLAEPVNVRRARVTRLIGVAIDDATIERVLTRLGIEYTTNDAGWQVKPPSYRYDLRIEEDFVEEVARVHGFDNLPRTYPMHRPQFRPVAETVVPVIDIKKLLAHRGYQEVVTYSFVEPKHLETLRPDLHALPLPNPISSDMSVMRTTIISGLLDTMQRNQSRQLHSMRLFETGLRFLPVGEKGAGSTDEHIQANHGDDIQIDDNLQQQNLLSGLIVGRFQPEGWTSMEREVDFFDAKADLQAIFSRASGTQISFEPSDLPMLHPGQRASIVSDGVKVGFVGMLNPEIQKSLDLSQLPIVFEMSLAAVTQATVAQATRISRQPSVRRDIALLVDEAVTHQALIDCAVEHGPDWLLDMTTFDVYQGEKVEKGKKSIALGLIMQDFSRTLEESEIEQSVATIVQATTKELGAVLRV